MSVNLPNPSLMGILFITSSHNGPQLIFSYPEKLGVEPEKSTTSKAHDDSSDEDIDEEEAMHSGIHGNREWDTSNLNYYLGTKKDLLSFLDEQEESRKKSIESSKETKSKETRVNESDSLKGSVKSKEQKTDNVRSKTIFGFETDYLCEMLCPPREMCNSRFELSIDNKIFLGVPIHKYDNGSWREHRKNKEENKKSHLNMFHLVFVMNPPIIEFNYRVDEMFHYVIWRLSLVLRYEQSKSDYITEQTRLINSIKEEYKNGDLMENLIEKSSLCKLISTCYDSISESKIANLLVNNKLRSFQIPIKTEFHSLPDSTVPYIPGSHLSSTVKILGGSGLINIGETTRYGMAYNVGMETQEELEDIGDSVKDVIYFALLLLDDPESIIRDIKTEPDGKLANFIRMIEPYESLLKLSMRNTDMSIEQIESFAFHLIYWRRARVIHPLNARLVYIISPMAPITINLYKDIKKFKSDFPTLPSLPHFLSLLSSPAKKPQQFATVIPSKDHKAVYMNALAWLIRHGYVTLLQTYIWLKVSRKVKMKVEEDIENETTNRKRLVTEKSVSFGTDNTSKDQSRIDSKNENLQEEDNTEEKLKGLRLPDLVFEGDDNTILLDPGRATTIERKWINKIIHEECDLSSELTQVFFKLLKYMNGKHSLEELLLKENVSRSELRKLLIAIEDYIISVRHW